VRFLKTRLRGRPHPVQDEDGGERQAGGRWQSRAVTGNFGRQVPDDHNSPGVTVNRFDIVMDCHIARPRSQHSNLPFSVTARRDVAPGDRIDRPSLRR